jgi:hypothetical protein
MPRISEIGDQSQMSALLKAGLTELSGDQHVDFYLYRKFVSPVDGMVYWIKVLPGSESATVNVTPGLADHTIISHTSVQAVDGGMGGMDIVGGKIVNPRSARDQGMMTKAQPIHVSVTGPASAFPDAWTTEVLPGKSFPIPPAPLNGVWVSAPSPGHKFTVTVKRAVSSMSGQPLHISQGGSLHYAVITNQDEDNVTDTNTVLFTSKDEIKPFNKIGPDEMYIGERATADGTKIRFAFSSRGNYYENADIWHYMGTALQSYNEPAIIDDPVGWQPDLMISNSIPIWLAMAGYVPPYPGLICPLPVHPSYLIPDNAKLPYASIYVDRTRALAATPAYGRHMEHDQLVSDWIKVTLWGASARLAADFMDFVIQYSRDESRIGMMREPNVIRDVHMPQVEFRVLTQKKHIEFEVSYLQSVSRNMARQVIKKAIVQFYPNMPSEALPQEAALVQE